MRGYRNGKTYTKLFSDRKNGGKEAALEAAHNYRQKLLEELDKIPQKERERRVVSKDSRNRTGELGVSRTSKKGPKGAIYECFSVGWRPEPGVQKSTSFSIESTAKKRR